MLSLPLWTLGRTMELMPRLDNRVVERVKDDTDEESTLSSSCGQVSSMMLHLSNVGCGR